MWASWRTGQKLPTRLICKTSGFQTHVYPDRTLTQGFCRRWRTYFRTPSPLRGRGGETGWDKNQKPYRALARKNPRISNSTFCLILVPVDPHMHACIMYRSRLQLMASPTTGVRFVGLGLEIGHTFGVNFIPAKNRDMQSRTPLPISSHRHRQTYIYIHTIIYFPRKRNRPSHKRTHIPARQAIAVNLIFQ